MFLNSQNWTWTCSFLAFSKQLWTMEIVLTWTTTPWSGDSKLLAVLFPELFEDCFFQYQTHHLDS